MKATYLDRARWYTAVSRNAMLTLYSQRSIYFNYHSVVRLISCKNSVIFA